MSTTVQTAVCKTLQALGLSPRKEHRIENAIAVQIRSSGPEYVLSRLSALSDWRKAHMAGNITFSEPWFSTKTHNGAVCPADAIGSQIWQLSDKAFFAVVGSLRKAVVLDVPTKKQLHKWKEAVRCENHSSEKRVFFSYSDKQLEDLERKLTSIWRKQPWFNVSHVTGTNIPGSGKFVSVKYDHRSAVKQAGSLLAGYEFSLKTAPLFVWQFLKDIKAATGYGKTDPYYPDDPVRGSELSQSLDDLIESRLHDPQLQDEAVEGSSFFDEEAYLSGTRLVDYQLGFAHTVGNIGFLQQEGGKLRTVANPNRLVQYANIPLGESLSWFIYGRDGVYTLNQQAGMQWAQSKLRQGISLSSFDMSSATDRLDFRKYISEAFHKAYENEAKYPVLTRCLDLFEETSSCPWSIPGHVADLLNTPITEVSWTVGQPLGLRPSFPILCDMNRSAAISAIWKVDGKVTKGHFACVGDDLIIETKYADAYMQAIRAMNGEINNDKCIVSDRYAEFCSHLITRSSIYPLKPRWQAGVEGSFGNLEKFSTKGLSPKAPKWVARLHNDLAAWSIPGSTLIPFTVSSSPKPLKMRIGESALIQATKTSRSDTDRVSLQAIYLRALKDYEKDGVPKPKWLASSHANFAYDGVKPPNKVINTHYRSVGAPIEPDLLGSVASDGRTSVPLQTVLEWDFRSCSYRRRKLDPVVSSAKRMLKSIKRSRVLIDRDTITASKSDRGVETTIVIDTSTPEPEILIGHSKGPIQSVQIVSTRKGDPTYDPDMDALVKKTLSWSSEEHSSEEEDEFEL